MSGTRNLTLNPKRRKRLPWQPGQCRSNGTVRGCPNPVAMRQIVYKGKVIFSKSLSRCWYHLQSTYKQRRGRSYEYVSEHRKPK
jgi:hypothetical protein